MFNLRLLQEIRGQIPLPKGQSLTHFVSDSETGRVYSLTSKYDVIAYDPLKNTIQFTYSVKSLIKDEPNVVAFAYVPDTQSVCLATRDGDIITVEVETGKMECVGSIDTGITAMSWSPDCEIVIFTTGEGNLLLMTQDWEVITEVSLVPDNEDNKIKLDVAVLPRITWRGDGNFFAISTNENEKIKHRVWERSCQVNSNSEAVKDQQSILAWKPSGDVIASVQVHAAKKDIIFFERNGLRHGEFTLKDNHEVLDVQWNADSDTLAVLMFDKEKNSSVVQLWTAKNYYWYLKQEYIYQTRVADIKWDAERGLVLHVTTIEGHYHMYKLIREVDRHDGVFPQNENYVAVIDGVNVYLTPMRRVTTPPPQYSSKITVTDGKVNAVAFCHGSNDLLILTSHNVLHGYKLNDFNDFVLGQRDANNRPIPPVYSKPHTHLGSMSLDPGMAVRQIAWLNADTWAALEANLSPAPCSVVCGNVDWGVSSPPNNVELPSRGLRFIAPQRPGLTPAVECEDGNVFKFESTHFSAEDFGMAHIPTVKFPTACAWVSSAIMGGEEVFIGLSERNKLYVNTVTVSSECNSFALHSNYVLFTTLSHVLRFMNLQRTVQENVAVFGITRQYDDSLREVENGAQIVSVVPLGTKVTLQMPRGNLEAIEPRALMVYYIRQLLADYEYGQAFTMMRRHRIDLNFFYDNNPRVFLDHLKDFVQQVDNVEYLNLFISALRDEDVTKTIFIDPWFKPEQAAVPALPVAPAAPAVANTVAGITGPIPAASQIRLPQLSAEPPQNKINLICNALRDVFQTLNPNKYLLPILTTYVTKNPQEIEEALKLVQGLKNAGNEGKSDALTAEKALKYLIFLVDVNKLYDIALGMYDFDLMMMVAQKSQKDPKEYIPFLTKLKGQEVNYQRYNIDMTLGRHDKALGHLSKAGPDYFNECVELMKKYKLYSKALDIFSDNSTNNDNPQMKVIMDAYGEYLFEERKLEEAANIWASNKNWERALDAYKDIPDWRNALVMAKRLQKTPEEITALLKDIAYKSTEAYKWDDAGILYEKINAIEDAVNSYVSGHSWEDAVRLSVLNDHEEWIEEKIKPALLLTAERLKEGLEKSLKKITKRYNRLIELRYEKMTQPRLEEDPTNLEESMSVYSSEASSMASGYSSISSTSSRLSTTSSQMSRGSNRSNRSKNSARKQNKKAARKKVSGRRGTPHEEEYILQRIGELFPTEKFQKEVANTLKTLVTFGYRTEAKALQQAMTTFLTAVQATLPLLNTPSPKTPTQLHEDQEKLERQLREGKLTTETQLINKLIDPVNIPKFNVEKVDWRVDYI